MSDPITTLGFALHVSNLESLVSGAPTTVATSRLLHAMGYALEGSDGPRYNDSCWALLRLLRTPRVVIKHSDLLDDTPERREHFRYALLLPQNTSGDTSANLVTRAASVIGSEAVSEVKAHSTLEIGQIHRMQLDDNPRFDEVWHVVCREPGNPAVRGLDTAFQGLVGGSDQGFGGSASSMPRLRLIVPVWAGEDAFQQWVDAIACLATAAVHIQHNEPSLILGVLPDEADLAKRIETALIRRGVVVGRESFSECEAAGCLWAQPEVQERIAGCVSSGGPLSPDHYAQWLLRGDALEEGGWERHLSALTGG